MHMSPGEFNLNNLLCHYLLSFTFINNCKIFYIKAQSLDDQAEQLAASIEKALKQSQELRKILTKKMLNEEKKLSRPTVQQISTKKLNIKPKNKNICEEKNPKKMIKFDNRKNALKLPNKKPKNFIAANKSSVKLMSQKNSKKKIQTTTESSELLKAKNKFPSVTELDNLIKKITLDTKNNKKSSTECLNNCPRHGVDNSIDTITEKKKVAINFAEAFDRFGVPDDLLKILKLYQLFIGKIDEEKIEKKSNIFLDKLETYVS